MNNKHITRHKILPLCEASIYLQLTESELTQLVKDDAIMYFEPQKNKFWFKKKHLNRWLTSNPSSKTKAHEDGYSPYLFG